MRSFLSIKASGAIEALAVIIRHSGRRTAGIAWGAVVTLVVSSASSWAIIIRSPSPTVWKPLSWMATIIMPTIMRTARTPAVIIRAMGPFSTCENKCEAKWGLDYRTNQSERDIAMWLQNPTSASIIILTMITVPFPTAILIVAVVIVVVGHLDLSVNRNTVAKNAVWMGICYFMRGNSSCSQTRSISIDCFSDAPRTVSETRIRLLALSNSAGGRRILSASPS